MYWINIRINEQESTSVTHVGLLFRIIFGNVSSAITFWWFTSTAPAKNGKKILTNLKVLHLFPESYWNTWHGTEHPLGKGKALSWWVPCPHSLPDKLILNGAQGSFKLTPSNLPSLPDIWAETTVLHCQQYKETRNVFSSYRKLAHTKKVLLNLTFFGGVVRIIIEQTSWKSKEDTELKNHTYFYEGTNTYWSLLHFSKLSVTERLIQHYQVKGIKNIDNLIGCSDMSSWPQNYKF